MIKVFGFGQLDMYTKDWMGKGFGVLVLICVLELAVFLYLLPHTRLVIVYWSDCHSLYRSCIVLILLFRCPM